MPNIDSIDAMIEGWATGSSSRVPKEVSEKRPLSSKRPTPLDAAEAIREAVLNSTGHRKSVPHWAKVAREVLGAKRLSQKRYDAVLDAGYAAGLFKLDSDTLSYPILVPLEPPEEEVEEPAPPPKAVAAKPPPARTEPALPKEGEWDPLCPLPCGHWSHQAVPDPDRQPAMLSTGGPKFFTKTVKVEGPGPELCPGCASGVPGDPRHQTGEWLTPVPEGHRRTVAKSEPSYPGFPGLCTDPKTGFYIGGLANRCNRYHSGPERCVYHASKDKSLRPSEKKALEALTSRKETNP